MRRGALALVVVVVLGLAAGMHVLVNERSFQLFGGSVDRVDTTDKVVALTFDDGPTCPDTARILDALGGTPATFFVVGSYMKSCPDAARRIVAAGSELGNHSWTHPHMVGVTPQQVADQIEPTDATIRSAGQTGDILFRPPYGQKLAVLPWWLSQHHRRTIMWDVGVETFDGTQQDTKTLVDETLAKTRPGSIILLHPWDGRTPTQQAIRPVIDGLRSQGYTFVTVSELLAR